MITSSVKIALVDDSILMPSREITPNERSTLVMNGDQDDDDGVGDDCIGIAEAQARIVTIVGGLSGEVLRLKGAKVEISRSNPWYASHLQGRLASHSRFTHV